MSSLDLLFKNERFYLFKNKYKNLFCLDLLEGSISESITSNYPFQLDENFFNKLKILTKEGHSWENYPQDEGEASFMEDFFMHIKDGDEIVLRFEKNNNKIKIIDYKSQKFLVDSSELDFLDFLNLFMKKDLSDYFFNPFEDIIISKLTNKKYKLTLLSVEREFLTEYLVLDLLTNREFKYYFVPIKYYIMDDLSDLSVTMEELMDMFQIERYLVKRMLKDNPSKHYNKNIEKMV